LREQIEVVNSDVLMAPGSTMAQDRLRFRSFQAAGEVRGKWRTFAGKPLRVTGTRVTFRAIRRIARNA